MKVALRNFIGHCGFAALRGFIIVQMLQGLRENSHLDGSNPVVRT